MIPVAGAANNPVVSTLGGTLRTRRLAMGLSLRELARRVGVSPPFMTDLEADRRHPGPEVMERIAAQLGMPLDELQALDSRMRPDVRRWVEARPEVVRLLRRIRSSPRQDELIRELNRLAGEDGEPGPPP